MSDVIKLLPDSVANQIAAGEVIQRPASVIKELVENAVDAGATNIQIILKDAGRTLIQVVDNGCGMSDTDARLAFERHATSKIKAADDLFALRTMGFRGEALASIAAIAQVDLRTMRHGESVGTRIVISGSKVESQEPEACQPGSNMMVKNLFFNVPARRKFLKKDSVELSNIMREFERLALVNTDVEFTLIHNDAVLHQLMKGSLKQRICDLFGKSLDHQLIPVATDTPIVKISGFVSLPENARRRNALQYLFVNGRNMRHPYFHKALMQCYEQLISADTQPSYFIDFKVDPDTIDVNIHPTKNEIKFENEQPIWQILVAAVKESLGKFNAVPSIDFESVDVPDIPAFNPNANAAHGIDLDTSYNPFATTASAYKPSAIGGGAWRPERKAVAQDWQKLYEDFTDEREVYGESSALSQLLGAESVEEKAGQQEMFDSSAKEAVSVMQIKNRYILSPSTSGLMVVDQHRAHIRILFDRYIDLARNGDLASQRVIFPEVLQLSPSQNVVLDSIIDEVATLGFDLAFLGDNAWSVNGVPSVIGDVNPVEVLMQIVESVSETGDEVGDSLRENIALSMAKASAIRAGQPLSQSDMEHLLSDLFKVSTPNYTPDGQVVISNILFDDISRLFK